MFDTNFKRGVLAVIGSVLVDISVGEINLLGFLYPYFVSYFRLFDKSVTVEDMRIIPMCWTLAQIYSCPLGVYVYTKIGFKWTYALFITTFCIVQWLSSHITNFKLFAVIYGFSGGTSQGALFILPVYCCWRYFDARHKAKISGIVISAYAISPLFTSFFALYVINPGNSRQSDISDDSKYYFSEDVARRVPVFLRMFGVLCAVVGYGGTLMVMDPLTQDMEGRAHSSDGLVLLDSKRGEKDGLEKMDEKSLEFLEQSPDQIKNEELKDQIQTITPISFKEILELFKIKEFKYLYGIMILCYMFPHMMNFSFKSIGLEFLKDDTFITIVGSMGAVVNALSRLIVGMAYYKYGYLKIVLSILAIEVIVALLYVPLASNKSAYVINTLLFELTYGGQLSMYPLVSDTIFKKKGAYSYSYLFSSFTISLHIALNLYSYLKEWINLYAPFVVVAVLTLAAFPLILTVSRMENIARSKPSLNSHPFDGRLDN